MKVTSLILALAAVSGFGTTSATADYRPSFYDKARVISSTPVYDHVNEPSRRCWTETIGSDEPAYRDRDEHGRAIVGAIAGGLLGSTVGKGSGKVAGAAIGAASGAAIGNHLDEEHDYRSGAPREVEHCTVSDNFHDVVVGYDVVYRFRGQDYNTRMAYDPGRWLEVNPDGSVQYR